MASFPGRYFPPGYDPYSDGNFVDRGLEAPKHFPEDPQRYLWGSHHPYSPFPGNALKWSSWVYDDATTYEGLTREDIPHMKGVMVFGISGGGAGITKPEQGDRYEGEFRTGFAHGLGQYTAKNGEVYRGEFRHGKKHGCGVLMDLKPLHKLVEKGMDPETAWKKVKADVEANAKYGTWIKDFFASEPSDDPSFCSINKIRGTIQELQSVVTRARMFRWKPDGEVTFRFTQDAHGTPAPVMQDPLHYPHGTGFMAPGPAGQCHPLPDDAELRQAMAAHAHNFEYIYNQYNFDLNPKPGSDWDKALRKHRREEAKKEAKKRKEEERQRQRKQRREERLAKKRGEPSGPTSASASARDRPDDDDEDLTVASSSGHGAGPGLHSTFASLSLGRSLSGRAHPLRCASACVRGTAAHVGARLQAAAAALPSRPRLARPRPMD